MKIIIYFILTLSIFFCNFAFSNSKINLSDLKIIDGDTVKARVSGEKEEFSIRLAGIDCYETSNIHRAYKQAYVNKLTIEEVVKKELESTRFLQEMYSNNKNKPVYLEFYGLDKYKRVLGVLYFGKLNVNQEMVRKGGCFIHHYKE